MQFDAADRRPAEKLQNISSWIHDFVLRLKTSTQFTESNTYAELNSREKVLTERQGLYNDMKALHAAELYLLKITKSVVTLPLIKNDSNSRKGIC